MKQNILLITLLALALVLSACGGQSAATPQPETAVTQPPATTDATATPLPTPSALQADESESTTKPDEKPNEEPTPAPIGESVSPIAQPNSPVAQPDGEATPELEIGGGGVMPNPGSEMDDVLQILFQLVQDRLGFARESVTVATAESREWRDASLGCPQPDQMYAQVITSGYLFELEAGDNTYEFHTDTTGNQIRLCKVNGTDASDLLESNK